MKGRRYTMKISASQAAKATGKSIPTITRAIHSGKISGEPHGKGWLIDPAELHRVFPAVNHAHNNVSDENSNMLGHETPETSNSYGALQREIEGLRERLQDKDAVIEDLRTDRNHWRDLAETTTRLLPAPTQPITSEPKRSWWSRVFGG